MTRDKEYKLAAVKAKQAGDLESAKKYVITYKKLEQLKATLETGRAMVRY
jgi:hypothetical protein